MKILIVSGHPHIPQFSGGVESCTHDLAHELQQRGHEVSVLCQLTTDGGLKGLFIRMQRKLSRQSFPADRMLGYPVYRQWFVLPSIATAVREIAPDLAIVQTGHHVRLAQALGALGVPMLFYLHNAEMDDLGGDPRTLTGVQFIANSQYTALRYNGQFGIDSIVIPPLICAERYVSPRKPANVTFINPNVKKGRDIALQVAEQCPEIPFTFVESWPLGPKLLQELRSCLARLPNVTLRRRTEHMKNVYSKAKILLVPSLWEETWGRVVTEAHFNGIPAVASNYGGLPEAVGPGGVLLDPRGPIEPWIAAVKRLWGDEEYYGKTSAAALAYSQRSQISPAGQIDALMAAAALVMSKRSGVENPTNQHGATQSRLSAG